MQYGASGRQLDTDFGGDGDFLWRASSALLFWEDVETSCKAVNMFPQSPDQTRPAGSLALLWPLFISLGFGQFIETLSCALQGRRPIQEVGMTVFEHSLAFAEAEAVVTRPLVMDSPQFFKPKDILTPDGTTLTLSRSRISSFANVPPEVLLISLISSFSHFTSNFLAITGYRARFRLVTTAIWGAAYMTTFAWSFLRLAAVDQDSSRFLGPLKFPTVCIVGFIPHLLMLVGIIACGIIYLMAFVLTVLSPPPGQLDNLTWKQRLTAAYENLHANIHLSAITPLTINWNEDFYTAMVKVGFTVLTAASEAVYLNEGTRVNVHAMTWLERKRLQDVLARRRQLRQSLQTIPSELEGESLAESVEIFDDPNTDGASSACASGYGRERKTKAGNQAASSSLNRDNGVGLRQRRGRWTLTYRFLRGILALLMAIQARLVITVLQKLRIGYNPRWLVRLSGARSNEKNPPSPGTLQRSNTYTHLRLRDVEALERDRISRSGTLVSEEQLSEYLYGWWKHGRRWGEEDSSGDYIPPAEDHDDNTSVISFAATSDADEWSDEEDDGQRTPTQDAYQYSRESTPMYNNTLDLSRLSHLLDPKTQEDREEAKLLARRLQSSNVLTRSQYRKALEHDEARVLTASRYPVPGLASTPHMSSDEEEQLLEEFLLSKRSAASPQQQTASNGNAGSWGSGADGMGSEGPQCVVCQLSPRTVLVWPCGCLSLCDDCRVGLASKNYTTCVCCRTNVVAYSRLYVP